MRGKYKCAAVDMDVGELHACVVCVSVWCVCVCVCVRMCVCVCACLMPYHHGTELWSRKPKRPLGSRSTSERLLKGPNNN